MKQVVGIHSHPQQSKPSPPVARITPSLTRIHGERRIDNYHWMRDRSDPAALEYLKAENHYTSCMMQPVESLQRQLYKELVGRIKATDLSVPERVDDYFYYFRTERGKQYPIFCRKKGSLKGKEQVLLDQNQLAAGHEFLRVGAAVVSPDHQLLAYSIDTSGAETFTLSIKDLRTGKQVGPSIPNTYYSVEWANDNRTLFYSVLNEAKRPYRLYRHRLGQTRDQDLLVFEEPDERFFLSLSKTRSRAFLLITLRSITTSEVWFLPAEQPESKFQLVQPRREKLEYYLEHHGRRFLILTNYRAPNFRAMYADVSRTGLEYWKVFQPYKRDVKVEAIDAFEKHVVVSCRKEGLRRIKIYDLADEGEGEHEVSFPEDVYSVALARNPEFKTKYLRFTYSSLITPPSVYDYNLQTRKRALRKKQPVKGGYKPQRYVTRRLFAVSRDGTQVPISIVHRRGLRRDRKNPLFLYGYGAYGISLEPQFSSHRLSLLDRGFVFAIAHVRGGGEMGRPWYEKGKLLQKKNSFLDFICCAEALIASGYTSKELLVFEGGSAGGLLIGAVLNMRPDLPRVVVAKVPFVDVVNTLLDENLPLTVTEFEEWGNPKKQKHYQYIKSYSPYDNIRAVAYPHLLVTAGLNDPRVPYWEAAKWTAKLRQLKTDENRLLLKTDLEAGHGGPSGRYAHIHEIAFEYAFILECLGIKSKQRNRSQRLRYRGN
ncbi:MAG: S9 family peptidase [Acidobacteria bacterium]|nr:S9 family peptidase [Acidobacteriota bacterium]